VVAIVTVAFARAPSSCGETADRGSATLALKKVI
jgi:hypothetical protein